MKKRFCMLLCAAALVLAQAMPIALAAEEESTTQYPIQVEEYTEGDKPRIRKVYQLALYEDPSAIPTGDFERDGRTYHLLDMTRKNEVGVDTKPFTKTVTMDSDTNQMEDILKALEAELEVTTEDGYSGLLRLDHTSVKVAASGYASQTKALSATRTYPNLSDADLSLVPKTIQDNGKSLTLVNVQWSSTGEGAETRYTATASYSGSASYKYATGYTVSANYTGEVVKTECSLVTYTAVFGAAEPLEPAEVSPTPAPEQAPASAGGSLDHWLPITACIGGGTVLIAAALLTFGIFGRRKSST